jgi:Uma2 family endonuclease
MNVSTHIKVDKAAFFRFIASQAEGRYEYDRGHIVQQMTGGTMAHSLISQRFISAFERRLDAVAWAVTGHSRGVETPFTVRYPDVLVEPMPAALSDYATGVPAVVVEVLSPTTEGIDFNAKLAEYGGLGSLKAYIVASQDQPRCWVWLRADDGHFPESPDEVVGLERRIDIPPLSLSISLAEIYRGIADGA